MSFRFPPQIADLIDASQKTRSKFYMPAMIFLGAEHGAAKQEILSLEWSDIKDFHFHDLRHTFCSNLILSGASLKEVKEMIGHANISMTDRYSHLSLNHKISKQDQLAVHYSNS